MACSINNVYVLFLKEAQEVQKDIITNKKIYQ